MSKIERNGAFYRTHRASPSAYVMGLEWEIPFHAAVDTICRNVSWHDWYAEFKRQKPEHFLSHPDSGGIEVKTPIDNLGQQKRWVKTLQRIQEKFGSIHEWDHSTGIHVHLSSNDTSLVSFCLIQDMGTRIFGGEGDKCDGFFRRLSHRGRSYAHNYRWEDMALRRKGVGHIEVRSFNSHRELMLPALEFTHAFTKYAMKLDNRYPESKASIENFIRYTEGKKKYSSICSLMIRTLNNEGYKGRPLWEEGKEVY